MGVASEDDDGRIENRWTPTLANFSQATSILWDLISFLYAPRYGKALPCVDIPRLIAIQGERPRRATLASMDVLQDEHEGRNLGCTIGGISRSSRHVQVVSRIISKDDII